MTLVSLLPSATEIVFALGLGDQLLGRSHRCDHPGEVSGLPVLTTGDAEAVSAVDIERIAQLCPDVVLAAGEDDPGPAGCAPLRTALRSRGLGPTVVGLDPRSLEGIFNSISTVGAFAEAEDEAVGLVELLRERLGRLENRVLERRLQGVPSRRAVLLEATRPPSHSGRWVPEMVRRAGGWELLGREGEESGETSWDEIRDVDPDVIVIATPCGDAERAARELEAAVLPDWFDGLAAVHDGELFAVDGAGLVHRPGPRVIDGIAVLAELLDPEAFAGAGPPGAWIPLGPRRIGFGDAGARTVGQSPD